MTDLFERWKTYRDEKDATNHEIGDFGRTLSEQEMRRQEWQIEHYNDLYAAMYRLQARFTDEDWAAYEADQDEIREGERQSWLIRDRYGDAEPSQGISDWWTR